MARALAEVDEAFEKGQISEDTHARTTRQYVRAMNEKRGELTERFWRLEEQEDIIQNLISLNFWDKLPDSSLVDYFREYDPLMVGTVKAELAYLAPLREAYENRIDSIEEYAIVEGLGEIAVAGCGLATTGGGLTVCKLVELALVDGVAGFIHEVNIEMNSLNGYGHGYFSRSRGASQ